MCARGLRGDAGDVDELVAFLASHLDNYGWQHLRIARELDEVGRPDEALAWAERGVRELADPHDDLVEYAAGRYAAADRADDVLALRRARFQAQRTLPNYQALRQAATDAAYGSPPSVPTRCAGCVRTRRP